MAHRAKHRDVRDDGDSSRGERLQKVLAAAGVGSRRDCEDLIREGRVEVDRQVVTELGTRVDPTAQEIRVDGEALRRPKRLYFAVNKPAGVVTTNNDPSGRARVIDLVPTEERVFAVGRLDRSSEGLIIVTNDGEFANRITHPRYGVEKTYLVRVAGAPNHQQLERLKKGVHLAEGYARAHSIQVKKQHGQSSDLIIVLNEGRNREIRRILARVGHKVLALKRVAVGPIKLGDLPLGGWRKLMPPEVQSLLDAAKENRKSRKSKVEGRKPKPTTARSASAGKGRGEADDGRYLQKQALFTEPLSLDDLLRDDLDEGPLEPASSGPADRETLGSVIAFDDDFSAPPRQKPPRRKPKPTQNRRASEGRGRRGEIKHQSKNRSGQRPGHAGKHGGKRRGRR